MKKINDDIARALERCSEALSITELSRRTGVGIWQLRKFVTRQSNSIREETWELIYPVIKPYLSGAESQESERPVRLGDTARKHHDLEMLVSDEKVLVDVFVVLNEVERADLFSRWEVLAGCSGTPTELRCLSVSENRLIGLFRALPETMREDELMIYVDKGTENLRRQRREMF